jgi:hypothetical protein
MPEPVTTITLAAVGMAAITEGIKFLYGQASELLKWRREKRKAAEGAQAAPSPQPTLMPRPDVFEPGPAQPSVDEGALERLAEPMGELCDKLSGITAGYTEIDPGDATLLTRVDALRKALEVVTGQRLTFQGEKRPGAQGPVVRGTANVDEVLGYAAGVAAGRIMGGTVEGEVRTKKVGPEGKAIGVQATEIGSNSAAP